MKNKKHDSLFRYLSLDIICSSKLTLSENCSQDKYPYIFSRQMEAIVYLLNF